MKWIILAGGIGSRLWPLSQPDLPKQFLSILPSGRSLLIDTIYRLSQVPDVLRQQLLFLCPSALSTTLLQHLNDAGLQISEEQIIPEPARRNTGPAIALASRYALERFGENEVLAFLPSDHWIHPISQFQQDLAQAETLAQQNYIVTLGKRPTYPETGYGYIQVADTHADWAPVQRFVEKPSQTVALRYLATPGYYWNTGIYVSSAGTFVKAFETHAPDIAAITHPGLTHALLQYTEMPNRSIDYAVSEHAHNMALVPMRADWSDLGCWDSVAALHGDNNCVAAISTNQYSPTQFVSSTGCFVKSDGGRPIALIGMENCLVVDTEKGLLICHKGASQQVSQLGTKTEELTSLVTTPS